MNPPAKPLAWSEQVREADSQSRETFIESHLDLVRYLALRIASRLPNGIELNDLVHDGIVGLLDATEKYDPGRSVRFRTYAESRIRGAILDGLRQKDWRPRSVRAVQRQLDETVSALSTAHQRPATEEEIAEALGVDIEAYRSMLRDASVGPMLSLEELPFGGDPSIADDELRPDRPLEHRDLLRAMAEEIEHLPDRERKILALYYHDGLNMKEIGAVLGITESRVCQLHGQAASRLRVALRQRLHVQEERQVVAVAGRKR